MLEKCSLVEGTVLPLRDSIPRVSTCQTNSAYLTFWTDITLSQTSSVGMATVIIVTLETENQMQGVCVIVCSSEIRMLISLPDSGHKSPLLSLNGLLPILLQFQWVWILQMIFSKRNACNWVLLVVLQPAVSAPQPLDLMRLTLLCQPYPKAQRKFPSRKATIDKNMFKASTAI